LDDIERFSRFLLFGFSASCQHDPWLTNGSLYGRQTTSMFGSCTCPEIVSNERKGWRKRANGGFEQLQVISLQEFESERCRR
jgi:hypothetical protein